MAHFDRIVAQIASFLCHFLLGFGTKIKGTERRLGGRQIDTPKWWNGGGYWVLWWCGGGSQQRKAAAVASVKSARFLAACHCF